MGYEVERGDLTFKKKIAERLSVDYDLPLNEAYGIVFSGYIQEKIDDDMDWSQHMGVGYWSNEIGTKMELIKYGIAQWYCDWSWVK